ncbi:MAG: methionine--tRNA ligase subunit beta, partial [Sphingobacteriaceae bacterium]
KQWALDRGKDWEPYWKAQDTKLVHFIGKDNIVFHCIIFPIMLHAHGEFILPESVPANEFMNLEGDKMSTSRGWSIEMHEYLQDFPTRVDELRYYLTAIAPETADSEFTWKDYQARINNELVAILGNFVNRVFVLMHKYFEGTINTSISGLKEPHLQTELNSLYDEIGASFEAYKFRQAQQLLLDVARLGNKYLTDKEPWKTFADQPEAAREALHECVFLIGHLATLMQPFMPETAQKLFRMLQLKESYQFNEPIVFEAGHRLNQPELLFQKVEDEIIDRQIEKLNAKKASMETPNQAAINPAKTAISFDQFSAMDIRVGTILAAEKVEKTQKLLKLTIDTGIDIRTVVSGIAEHYAPDAIIGQQVTILVNLAPRELKGIVSEGMILMAENADGALCFVTPSTGMPNGSTVR